MLMLETIDIYNPARGTLNLGVRSAESGFVVTNVEGLGPVQAELASSDFALVDGSRFHASRVGSRNIVLSLDLGSDPQGRSPRVLRQMLYSVTPPKSTVTLTFQHADDFDVTTTAVVESIETVIFGERPIAVISYICHDPYFYALESVTQNFTSVSTTTYAEMVVNSVGDAPSSVNIKATAASTVTSVTVRNIGGGGSEIMNFSIPMVATDALIVETKPGSRSVDLTSASGTANSMSRLDPTSKWISVYPGANTFRATFSAVGAHKLEVTYTPRYWGI